jgi:chemotaxis protein MotA
MISVSTFFGIIAGGFLIGWGIMNSTDNYMIFYNQEGLAIVLGGTITASFVGYRYRYILRALFDIVTIFIRQPISPNTLKNDVGMIIGWNKLYQAEGKMAAQKILDQNKDPYIKYVFGLLTTGYTGDEIREFAENNIEETYFRKLTQSGILNNMAASAPAFGMVGTLIGLIVMLSKLEDPSQLGPSLSVALMTTLYGVLLARFIFAPASTKTKQKISIQRFREYLLLEGVLLMLDKKSNFFIQDKLNSFLDRNHHFDMSKDKAKGKK